ncbi:unnamed protein product [Psylliodes chrysocephalus]|uniref:C2H2-type domain-containing protein n=1 Tax=Psylliodes chrysocephalus TaxID=3402493 RepID=A0A9P0DAJ8_9CUCU|nr:unnamed protein product [Psylliodes chrysocephala]
MSTFLKNNIKEEIHEDDNFDSQEIKGKIVDYQFLVRPKQEPIDTKPNPAPLEFVGEVIDAYENESEENNHVTRKIRPTKETKEIKVFFCKHCDFKTTYKTNFTRHRYYQHQEGKPIRVFVCQYCHFKTHNRNSFKRHTNVHQTSKENLPHGCTLCEFKCLDKSYIAKHMIRMHTEQDRTFFCNICGHAYFSLSTLTKHRFITHTAKRKFDCDLCHYKATSNSKLNDHKEYVHFEKRRVYKQVVCDMCGKKLSSIPNLNIHLLRIHKVDVEVKTYICYTCGKKYFKRYSFTQHVLQHSKHEKMFCANCDYSTFNKSNLTQHMVKHSKHIKMHKCNICSFETKRPHTLRHHIKTHLNKP